MAISSYLLGALIVWGGLGWIIDRVAGTGQILTALGMLVGAALGVYLIYLKYGKEHDENS